jgi:hypothetical protein
VKLTSLAALLVALAGAGESPEARTDAAVRVARETLRVRLSVPDSRINLMDVRPARWSDASLGCPEKGHVYAQVLTEGYTVHLRVDDRTFDVRVAGGRAVICQGPGGTAEQAVAAARLARLARLDLAASLGLPEAEVHVELVRPRTWTDDSLGCAPAGPPTGATPSGVRGFLLELTAGGRRYEYHADTERVVRCAPVKPAP